MLRLAAPTLLAGFAVAVGGCGGADDKAPPSDQLVRLAIQDTLDFRMDEGDGPEHIVRLDEVTVIRRNGDGTRTSAIFDGSRPFRVPANELDQLEEALSELDLQDLEGRFGTDESAASKTTLRYDGTTVVIGDRINEVNRGEGDEQAEQFFDVEAMIERLSWRAIPARIKRAYRRAVKEAERLTQRLNASLGRAQPATGRVGLCAGSKSSWVPTRSGRSIPGSVRPTSPVPSFLLGHAPGLPPPSARECGLNRRYCGKSRTRRITEAGGGRRACPT